TKSILYVSKFHCDNLVSATLLPVWNLHHYLIHYICFCDGLGNKEAKSVTEKRSKNRISRNSAQKWQR
ncbi:hypothetical protein NPIL_282611, partial [Nephila pilipes]